MLKHFFRLLGWVPSEERKGTQIDFSNAWSLSEIHDKRTFLKWLLSLVPNESIWSIEGLYDPAAFEFLGQFRVVGQSSVFKATAWPRLTFLKVKLDTTSKPLILSKIAEWNLDSDFIHQHIYCDDTFYLTAYDNLVDTWLSKIITAEQLQSLICDGVVSTENGVEFEVASEERWRQLTNILNALVDAQRAKSFPAIEYWAGFFDAEARATFWWEAEDNEPDAPGNPAHTSSRSGRVDVFGTMIDQFRDGDCEILGWRKLSGRRARVEYEPWGGFGCLQVLVEALGHRVETK